MRYTLAELGIEVNLRYDYALRRMKDYKSEFGGTHIRINIEYENNIILPEYKKVYPFMANLFWTEFDNGDYGAFRALDLNSRYIIFFARWNSAATEVTLKMADVTHFKGGISTDLREFSYLGELMHILMPFHNRIVLHSSALSLDNNGVAFSAESGTGKSTHANSWKKLYPKCIAINDDTPIVYNTSNGFHICGSPWSGKTEINSNISIPLKAIVCLKQDGNNHIEKILPKVSIPFLLHEIKASPLKQREENKLNILSDLISSTNIYMLGCLPDDEAAIICKEKIWKEM